MEALLAARSELETEYAEHLKVRKGLERQQKEAAKQLAWAKRDLGELLGIRRNLRITAQVVVLSEYQKVVKLIDDNEKYLASKRPEFVSLTQHLRVARTLSEAFQSQFRGIEAELATFGRVINLHGQPRSQEAGPERPEIREPEAVRVPH